MANYYISETGNTPAIKFDVANGNLEIRGPSVPDNAIEFYQPLAQLLERYSKNPHSLTTVNIQFDYFNVGTSEYMMCIFKILENIYKGGSAMVINWYYEPENEAMIEAGKTYQGIFNFPFHLVEETED
jgi:hypothetical protein